MNTPVKFELAKLLKEKGFDVKTEFWYDGDGDTVYRDALEKSSSYKFNLVGECFAPTIAEVVYWIYSKYDIWISLIPDSSSGHKLLDRKFSVSIFRFNMNLNVQAEILRKDKNILYFNLPENAFEYAIEYILNTYKPTS